MRTQTAFVVLLLTGCGGDPEEESGPVSESEGPVDTEPDCRELSDEDADGDGFSEADGDCDDGDRDVVPGSATDSDGDGWDDACDCAPDDPSAWRASGTVGLVRKDDVDGLCDGYCARCARKIEIISSDLTNLDGLECLAYVDSPDGYGWVDIYNNPRLTSLEGLSGLRRVQAYLSVAENDAIGDLSGLRSLEWAGSAQFYSLGGLVDLSGLDSLTEVPRLEVVGMADLEDLSGMPQLRSVETLYVRNNPSLVSLTGIEGAAAGLGRIDLSGGSLVDLSALEGVEAVDTVEIVGTGATDLVGLSALGQARVVRVCRNDALTDLSALHGLESVDELWIAENPLLEPAEIEALVGEIEMVGAVHTDECFEQGE